MNKSWQIAKCRKSSHKVISGRWRQTPDDVELFEESRGRGHQSLKE